jgi:hypothetical protein
MIRARMRIAVLCGAVLLSISTSHTGYGQEHRHIPDNAGNPHVKQPEGPAVTRLGLAELGQLALQHNPTLIQAALQVEAAAMTLPALMPPITLYDESRRRRGCPAGAGR